MLFMAAQHAREWITPEMVRRLIHYVVDGYGTDRRLTYLVNKTELWFVPVANPDGYDFTFQPGPAPVAQEPARTTTATAGSRPGDGVDPNRNFPTKWGYDNEGSSPEPGQRDVPRPVPVLRARNPGPRQSCRRVASSS